MQQGKIIRIFLNVDLRNGHDGLSKIARHHKIDMQTIDSGSYIIFINTQKNKIKLYAANEVLAYLRLHEGKINMNTIKEFPKVFNGTSIDYSEALKIAVEKQMQIKRSSMVSLQG